MSDSKPRATISLPSDFFFGELRSDPTKPATTPVPPPARTTLRVCRRLRRQRLQHHLSPQ